MIQKDSVEKINALPQADRRRFLRALRYSLHGDGDEPPKLMSPAAIEEETSISVEHQYRYGIVIDKRTAVQFLAQHNYIVSEPAYRKQTTAEKYKKIFDSPNANFAGNKLVFTFLEVLYIEGIIILPDLPEECQ